MGARAFDLCAHLVQAACHIGHLGLAGRILEYRFAFRHRGRHHDVMRRANRNLGERDNAASQSPGRRLCHHIAAVEADIGAQSLKTRKVQVNWPGSDGASARQ